MTKQKLEDLNKFNDEQFKQQMFEFVVNTTIVCSFIGLMIGLIQYCKGFV